MDALLLEMTPETWPQTVGRFLKIANNKRDYLNQLTVDGNYAWKVLLDLSPDTVLLDIGCGFGALAKNIAPHVGKTYVLDPSDFHLSFSKKRFSFFNPNDDITLLAGGDGRYLPFPDKTFDCVVCSRISHWAGTKDVISDKPANNVAKEDLRDCKNDGKGNHKKEQLDFLKEIRRILKPEGQLFITIENRLSYEQLSNCLDDSQALQSQSLFKRVIAILFSNMKPQKNIVDKYSIFGYRRLLKTAGFLNIDFFALWGEKARLKAVFPVAAHAPNWHASHKTSIKDRLKRSPFFVPMVGISACPEPRKKGALLERILQKITSDLGIKKSDMPIVIKDYIVTSKDKAVMLCAVGKEKIVLKFPFSSLSIAAENQNARMLKHINRLPDKLSYCPQTVSQGSIQNLHYFVEEQVSGKPLRDVFPGLGRLAFIGTAEDVLNELNPLQTAMPNRPFIDEFYTQQVSQPLDELSQVIDDPNLQADLSRYFHNNLYGARLPCGLCHGDFGVNNIFVLERTISGLIDWETSSRFGLPILDAIHYLVSVQSLFDRNSLLPQNIQLLVSCKWPIPEEWNFLIRQYERYEIDPSFHEALTYLYWLHHVTNQLGYRLIYDESKINNNILGVIHRLLSVKGVCN
ncbi:MAG: methyltransferase domain-containing protein [Waddliaceae bacterium]